MILLGAQACAASSFESYSAATESAKSQWEVGNFEKTGAAFMAAEKLASRPADRAHARLWIGHCAYQTGQYHAARKDCSAVLAIQGVTRDGRFTCITIVSTIFTPIPCWFPGPRACL